MGLRSGSIKKSLWLAVIAGLLLFLSSCSSNEVIRVGVPFTDGLTEGVLYQKDIKDPVSLGTLRTILNSGEEIEPDDALPIEPHAVFTIDRADEGGTELRRFVWYRENGRAVLSNERNVMSPKDGQEFFHLTTKQTRDLKEILQ